jgi:predicted RNA-binding Zn ribbon-like protein
MTKLLEHAVDGVRGLPAEVQDELARLLLQVAGEEQPVIRLTPEERADLADADAEIARGEFATDEQIRSMLAKRPV